MIAVAWVGDKYHVRRPLIVFNCIVTVTGLVAVAFVENKGARFFEVFSTVMSTSANIPTIMAYQANNITGQWKRVMSSAIFVGMGGIRGIAGALVFRVNMLPSMSFWFHTLHKLIRSRYRPGIIACLA
jgi:hypothetical protein